MIYYEDIIVNLKEKLLEANTSNDIKKALNDFFEIANECNMRMGIQWNVVGCMFDQYRRDEL